MAVPCLSHGFQRLSLSMVQAGAEYNKKDYAFQSSGVVSTLQDLLKQFREERNQGQEEWKKTKQAMAAMGRAGCIAWQGG